MPNRLAEETSPYLREHGEDPVDWYPWGEEAFSAAREAGRPIFLSVGYASCHWCHVMHRESFSDPGVAALLDSSFVSVKVDRESRPDIDEQYMAYVVAATGHGGWPMSVFLTPDLVPIFGGTYFPPSAQYGVPSFAQVLTEISEAFELRRAEVGQAAEEALEYVQTMFAPMPHTKPTLLLLESAARRLLSESDSVNGGFGGAPKFPQAPITDFLLAYYELTGDEEALGAVEAAARGMVRGGIYDHAGGGMARYSVDAEWLVPHFEKMLYDNAQLLSSLAFLHRLAPSDEWKHTMTGTIRFLDRDLAAGPVYASSLDADTNGVEGSTYVWSYEELAGLLDVSELEIAVTHLRVRADGNWEGTNILTRRDGLAGNTEGVDRLLEKLLGARAKRPQPARDEKLVLSWNALAALGLLDASEALSDNALLDRGLSLVRYLLGEAVGEGAEVRRLLGDPASKHVRILEDHVGLSLAALRAHDLARDATLLDSAQNIFDAAEHLFHDGDGTWYLTPPDTELPVRPREQHDSPTPSGPSLAALVALRLAEKTGDSRYRELAEVTLARLATLAESAPSAAGSALAAMVRLVSSS